ncbi:MAG TPA: hypothetical protein VFQ61_27935 [Polyangiaceae bacterium]|nr:hypothetical protein [Polyangiaceae bacterium]
MKKRVFLAAVCAAAALPLEAHAQQWLADRQLQEGIGVRVGDLELHPGLGGEFGYDSNYFQRAGDGGNPPEPTIAAYRLRIVPSLSLSTLGAQRAGANAPIQFPKVNFRANAHAAYNELFAAESKYSDDVSGQRHLNVGAGFNLDILPHRPVGADLYADYVRLAEPSNSPDQDFAFDRDAIRAGAGVSWRPGGGLFEWRFGYEALYNFFEVERFKTNNNINHTFATRGRWRFLPRTALLFDGSYRFTRYTGPEPTTPTVYDGDWVRSRVGLNGLITPRVSLLAMVGWASSFFDAARRNADTVIAQAEAKYFVLAPPGLDQTSQATTGLSTVWLGYVRDAQNSYLNAYYTRDRAYIGANYFLGGAFVTSVEAGWSYVHFPVNTVASFNQRRIDARLFAEYRFSNSFGLNATVRFDRNDSDTVRPLAGQMVALADDLDFIRWQAYLGVRWFL